MRAVPWILSLLGACDEPASPAPPGPPPSVQPSADVSAAVSAALSVPPQLDVATRAARGDIDALKRLELRPPHERTTDEALAIAAGHAALARDDAKRVAADLEADPELRKDPATLAYAYRLALDPEVAPTLLVALSTVPDPVIADLVHDLAARGEPGARLVLLARDLLARPPLSERVSKPLRVALDLDDARTCWQVANVLPRAVEHADARALARLEALAKDTGCGKKRDDDCWVCLRDEPSRGRLERALESARARKFEPPWALER